MLRLTDGIAILSERTEDMERLLKCIDRTMNKCKFMVSIEENDIMLLGRNQGDRIAIRCGQKKIAIAEECLKRSESPAMAEVINIL
jgi:hypothetical protein